MLPILVDLIINKQPEERNRCSVGALVRSRSSRNDVDVEDESR